MTGISATPIANRFIKASIQLCNLLLRSPVTLKYSIVIACHLCYKLAHAISALLDLPWSTVGAIIMKQKHLGATKAQPQKRRARNLKVQGELYISIYTINIELQTLSGSNISTRTILRKLSRPLPQHKHIKSLSTKTSGEQKMRTEDRYIFFVVKHNIM